MFIRLALVLAVLPVIGQSGCGGMTWNSLLTQFLQAVTSTAIYAFVNLIMGGIFGLQ